MSDDDYIERQLSEVTDINDYNDGLVEYVSYISAADVDGYGDDEIPADSWRRYSIQSYFEDPPEGDSGIISSYIASPDAAEVFVDTTDERKGGENTNVAFQGEYPDEGDPDYDFEVSLTVGLGPLSIGPSISLLGSPLSVNTPANRYSQWEFDFAPLNEPEPGNWPDGQEETVGARLNINPNSTGSEEFYWETNFEYNYYSTYYGDITLVHSETTTANNTLEVTVV